MDAAAPLVELSSISKAYGSTQALDSVSLTVRGGSIHALVGENGAGKSTLVKVMSGIVDPDAGEIRVDGRSAELSTRTAGLHGIHIVHQELALLSDLTVAQNVFIGRPPRRGPLVDVREAERRTAAVLAELGSEVDPAARVGSLGTAAKQLVEIARGLAMDARVLILDEPTAALSPQQAEGLFAVLRTLARSGRGIVYISHRLGEVLSLADQVTVLKDGRHVATRPAKEYDVAGLASAMVGRDMRDLFPAKPSARSERVLLRVTDLIDPPQLHGASLDLHEGEVLGLCGLEGSGQDELLACLAGDGRPVRGELELDGRRIPWRSVPRMMREGFGYVPRDRKLEGLLLESSGIANVAFPLLRSISRLGLVSRDREREIAVEAAGAAGVKGDVARDAGTLSGGNQQKLSFARLVAAGSRVMLLNQPTRGVDIGSKQEIYSLVRRACEQPGTGAVVTSPELPELVGLCDRVLVMNRGRIVGEAPPGVEEGQLLEMAAGR